MLRAMTTDQVLAGVYSRPQTSSGAYSTSSMMVKAVCAGIGFGSGTKTSNGQCKACFQCQWDQLILGYALMSTAVNSQ